MAKNYFNRYVWLIDTIDRHGYITLRDLSRQWERSAVNDDGGPLAERTFHNHRQAIEDTFGIEIRCDRSRGYYIANGEDLEEGGIRAWLLESLSMSNLLNESGDMRDRILFEKVPSSRRWLSALVNAMHDGRAVEMTYQSYNQEEAKTFIVHPWCLKLFRQRWYVLARSENYDRPRIYSLDRIHEVRETEAELDLPSGFHAAEFFSDYFGVFIGTDEKPETVEIRVRPDQAKYFESLPLHPTQMVVDTTDSGTVFRYRLVPTFDFRQELLRHGPSVEVLKPASLRDEIRDDIAAMVMTYGMTLAGNGGEVVFSAGRQPGKE